MNEMDDQNSIELSVILPSYLEEENLRILLPRLNTTLKSQSVPYEILVVDTHMPLDKTEDVCLENGCIYVNRSGGNTFGDAVRSGLAKSKGKFVLCMDADGSHPPEFIPELFEFRDPNRIVIASRYIDGGFTENSRILVLMSRILNLSYSIVFNIKCKDVSNSFKIYPGGLVRQLRLHCNNFDIIEEILIKATRTQKLTLKEVPFAFKKRMFGDTKRNLFIFIFTYFFTMIKLRLITLRGPAASTNSIAETPRTDLSVS